MFNRILNRKTDSGRSPARSTSAVLDGKAGSIDVINTEESIEGRNVEGFLCPSCYHAFPTADSLQNHYESIHSDSIENAAATCPACKMCLGSEAELHAHYKRHHSNEKEQGEIEALRAQVTALEVGKGLVVNEMQTLHSKMVELFNENSKIREERDSFEQKTALLSGELAYLKADFDENRSQKTSLESQLLQARGKVRELEIEIQQRPEADDVSLLKQEIVSVQKMMDKLTLQREAEKDDLQKQCSDLEELCNRLQSENSALGESLKSAPNDEDLRCLEGTISGMKSRIEELQTKCDEIASEKTALQRSLEQYSNYDDLKRDASQKDGLLLDAKRLLGTKDELIKKLNADLKTEQGKTERMKDDIDQLFAKIEDGEGASTAILQLKEENARLQEQLIHEQKRAAQVTQDLETKLEALYAELKQAEMLKEKNCELEDQKSQIKSQFVAAKVENAKLIKQLKDQDNSLSALKESHKNSLMNLQSQLESMRAAYNTKTESLEATHKALQKSKEVRAEQLKNEAQLKDSLESVTAELAKMKKAWASEMAKMKLNLEQLENEKSEVTMKLAHEEEKFAHLNSQHLDLSKQHEDLVLKLKDFVQKNADNESLKVELETKLNELREEVQKNQENEAQLLSTVESMNEIKKQLSEKVMQCDKEASELRASIGNLSCEKEALLKQTEMMSVELSEKKTLCDFQENKITELTECYQDEKENRSREVQSLESAKQLLIGQKMALLKDIDSLKEENAKKVASLQERISALEADVPKMEATNKALTSKMENVLQSSRKEKEEWEKLQSHLQAQIGVLNENANTLREDLQAEQNKREVFEQKVDELSGSKLELEAKLDNALDERRSLLDRCLKRETECEKLQKSTADLRRKLDDTTAALQELGRENQTLQIENTKHLARKWTDDNEVTHCTACGKLFTVTVRKHHCRNCGNIFCNECSSRTAAIASSKKPVRVCDLCYAEVSK